MTLRMLAESGELLHPVEVDLLCTFAEVDAPFPLEVASTGHTEVERQVMFHGAREHLTERGLADEQGPLGVAEDFVYLLRSATGVVDLVLATEEIGFAAVVLSYQEEALLVTQDMHDPLRAIRMKALTVDDAVDALLYLVPELDAAMTAPFSLPRRAVTEVFEVMMSRMPEPSAPDQMSSGEIEELLRSHGIEDRMTRRMLTHLQPVVGNGQAGLARRDDTEDQWHRDGEELRWLDTERGRFQLAGDAEWLSVNPLPRADIRAEFRRLIASSTR